MIIQLSKTFRHVISGGIRNNCYCITSDGAIVDSIQLPALASFNELRNLCRTHCCGGGEGATGFTLSDIPLRDAVEDPYAANHIIDGRLTGKC